MTFRSVGGKTFTANAKDANILRRHRWTITRDGYVITCIKGKVVSLGRLLLGARKGQIVDHIDGNPLNNTRRNLRVCNRYQSAQNRGPLGNMHGFKGVHFDKKRKKYRASLLAYGKIKQTPRFNTAKEAALAYDALALKFHGDFARTNF
mgnify:FL=1